MGGSRLPGAVPGASQGVLGPSRGVLARPGAPGSGLEASWLEFGPSGGPSGDAFRACFRSILGFPGRSWPQALSERDFGPFGSRLGTPRGPKNEQFVWEWCNFKHFRPFALKCGLGAFGGGFWSRFGAQVGAQIDHGTNPDMIPKTRAGKVPPMRSTWAPTLLPGPPQESL